MSKVFYLDGQRASSISMEALPESTEEFHFAGDDVHVFTRDDEKRKWLNSTGFSIYYQKGLSLLTEAIKSQEVAEKNELGFSETLQTKESEGRKLIEKHMAEAGVKSHSAEDFLTFMTAYDPKGKLKPYSAFIYDGCQFTGSWRYLETGVPFPKYSWISFNDKLSSVRVFAETLVLCEHTWYRGRRCWLGGYPCRQYDFCGQWWDNRVSSSWSF